MAVMCFVITFEVIYEFETLIWVQQSTNTFCRESGAAGRFIQECIEIDAVVVIKQGLKIHDNQIVVVSHSWLLIDMVKDVLNGQSCLIHRSMSQNTLEIEVQGVDKIGVVHQQVFLSECCFFGLRFVGFHDGVESSWHEDLIGLVDIIENNLHLR